MVEAQAGKVFTGRLLFVTLLIAIIFVQLMPIDTLPRRWPWPDLLVVTTMVWVARRPDFAPFWVIAGLFLLTDLLFQRPPGLWAALVLILSEAIRKRAPNIRNMPIGLEWGTVTVGIVAITLIYRLTLAILFLPQALTAWGIGYETA